MNNFLSKTGLSITQAQSASNLANQKAMSIKDDLDRWQIIKASVKLDGTVYVLNHGVELINSEVKEMLMNISQLHAVQAFLMYNLKERQAMMKEIEYREFEFEYDVEQPIRPEPKESISIEEFNPFSAKEQAEYLAVEAYAAHIGQFIHKDEQLDKYRKNFHAMMDFDTRVIGEETLPVTKEEKVSKDALDALHEDLSKEHRKYNQRLNYFKAKSKNLLDKHSQQIYVENNAIQDYNEGVFQAYNTERQLWNDKYNVAKAKARNIFDAQVSSDLNKVSQLRITIPQEYKELIDELIETGDKESK